MSDDGFNPYGSGPNPIGLRSETRQEYYGRTVKAWAREMQTPPELIEEWTALWKTDIFHSPIHQFYISAPWEPT